MITYDANCAACYLGHAHTQQQHDFKRKHCHSWVCGGSHPITDHMPLREAINWRNNERERSVPGAINVHWGFIAGNNDHGSRYLFAVLR